jgi:hypothetical protein
MKRFVEGEDRSQSTLFPERLDEYIADDNPVRVIDVFVDELGLSDLGFERVVPQVTGRPGYHPATLLKIYVYVDFPYFARHFKELKCNSNRGVYEQRQALYRRV